MPSILTRPMDVSDRAWVSSTAIDTAIWDHGGRTVADRREIRHLADDLIDHARVTVATFADEPSLLAYVARDPVDASVELLYLRLSLADVKGVQWRMRVIKDPKTSPTEREALTQQAAAEMRMAVQVARALLAETEVVLRRRPPWLAMEALTRGGFRLVVRPRTL